MTDIRADVWKVLYDSDTGSSVVLLRTETDQDVVPIWVGRAEALSIAAAAEDVSLGRPMTHDLLKTVMDAAKMNVSWVRIHDLQERTFFARIHVDNAPAAFDFDARPSDAIAVALRCDAPIFVSEKVLKEVLRDSADLPTDTQDLSEDFLENLPDELFGKYKM